MSFADPDIKALTVASIAALVDDARTLASELCDAVNTECADRIQLTALRRHLNEAVKIANQLKDG